ncbi:Jade-1-like isoform X6, partial [Achlya hypogyna]
SNELPARSKGKKTKKTVDATQSTIECLFQAPPAKRPRGDAPAPSSVRQHSPVDPSASVLQRGAQVIAWLEELSTGAMGAPPSPEQSPRDPPHLSPLGAATAPAPPKPLPTLFDGEADRRPSVAAVESDANIVPPPPTRATPPKRPVQRRMELASPVAAHCSTPAPRKAASTPTTKPPLHVDVRTPPAPRLPSIVPSSPIVVYTPEKASPVLVRQPSKAAPDEDCQVCGETHSFEDDPILFCDGCNVGVHQQCYGVREVPAGAWYCAFCADGSRDVAPKCTLCPVQRGAFQRTQCGQWVHVQCFLWIPELYVIPSPGSFTLGSLETLDAERFTLKCEVCKTTDGFGIIQCAEAKCLAAFHVSCGFHAHYTLGQTQAGDGMQFLMYCPSHSTSFAEVASPSAVFATPDKAPKKARKRLQQGVAKAAKPPKKKRLRANKDLMAHYMEMDVGVDGEVSSDDDDDDDDGADLNDSFICYDEVSQVVSPASMQAIYRRRSLSPGLGKYFSATGVVAACLRGAADSQTSVEDDADEDDGTLHHGYRCDGCDLSPIQGVRYSCTTCEAYDLCTCCYSTRLELHDASHSFCAIQTPVPPTQSATQPAPPTAPTGGLTEEQKARIEERRRMAMEIQRQRQQPNAPPTVTDAAQAVASARTRPPAGRSGLLRLPRPVPAAVNLVPAPVVAPVVDDNGPPTFSLLGAGAAPPVPLEPPAVPSFNLLGAMTSPPVAASEPTPSFSLLRTTEAPSFDLLAAADPPSFSLLGGPPPVTLFYHPRLKHTAFAAAWHEPGIDAQETARADCDVVVSLRMAVNIYAYEQLARLLRQPSSPWISLAASYARVVFVVLNAPAGADLKEAVARQHANIRVECMATDGVAARLLDMARCEAADGQALTSVTGGHTSDVYFAARYRFFSGLQLPIGTTLALTARFMQQPVARVRELKFNWMHWKRMLPWTSDATAQAIFAYVKLPA